MKLLIATTNPAKIDHYRRYFKSLDHTLEIYSLIDLDPDHKLPEPIETGENEAQNSILKAKYYKQNLSFSGLVFAEDSGMTLHGVDVDDNPKKEIKKPIIEKFGKVTPENFVNYYSNLALKYGGRIDQEWVFGYTLMDDDKIITKILKKPSILVSEIREPLYIGYPLNSVTKVLRNGGELYLSQLDTEEWENYWGNQVVELLNELLTPFIN